MNWLQALFGVPDGLQTGVVVVVGVPVVVVVVVVVVVGADVVVVVGPGVVVVGADVVVVVPATQVPLTQTFPAVQLPSLQHWWHCRSAVQYRSPCGQQCPWVQTPAGPFCWQQSAVLTQSPPLFGTQHVLFSQNPVQQFPAPVPEQVPPRLAQHRPPKQSPPQQSESCRQNSAQQRPFWQVVPGRQKWRQWPQFRGSV